MKAKTKSKRKKRPEQFKLEAVRLLETRGERTAACIAASLGIAESLLHSWKKKYGSAAAQVRKERGGETAEEELKRLRREMTQLKQERDILRKSVTFFARDRS
jgi:transposase